MKLFHSLYIIITIAQLSKEFFSLSANIGNDTNKKLEEKLEELKKEISLELQKLRKENQYLQKEMNGLHQKTNINFNTANCSLTISVAHAYAKMILEY